MTMSKKLLLRLLAPLGGVALLLAAPGCTSDYSGGGNVDVHGSFYVGVGYYDGFYGGPWYGPPPPVVVTPPPSRPPGGIGGGGGNVPRPTPMPSMPMPRGGGGMRR